MRQREKKTIGKKEEENEEMGEKMGRWGIRRTGLRIRSKRTGMSWRKRKQEKEEEAEEKKEGGGDGRKEVKKKEKKKKMRGLREDGKKVKGLYYS